MLTTATFENMYCLVSLVGREIFENTIPVINALKTKLPKLSTSTTVYIQSKFSFIANLNKVMLPAQKMNLERVCHTQLL